MAFTSSDVPALFDVWIDGTGYLFADDTDSPYFSRHPTYTYTPTFLERTNVGAAYGDDQQAFWLTEAQRDWSAGEDQRYLRPGDASKSNRYYLGQSVECGVQGQISNALALYSGTSAAAEEVFAATVAMVPGGGTDSDVGYAAGSTHLISIATGTNTDLGAHGLAGGPTRFGIAADALKVYLSAQGAAKVRSYNQSTLAFADFSATDAGSLCVHNNTLYGLRGNYTTPLSELVSYSTAGVSSVVYTWKNADGSVSGGTPGRMVPFGGKLALLWTALTTSRGSSVWTYDGTSTSILAWLPPDFRATDMCESGGVLYVAGERLHGQFIYQAVYAVDSTSVTQIWVSHSKTAVGVSAIAAFMDGAVFTDVANGQLAYYNAGTGSVSRIADISGLTSSAVIAMASGPRMVVAGNNANTTVLQYPHGNSLNPAATGYVYSSLFDFDNSLQKLFRTITVYFEKSNASDSVDIAYQTDSLTGSWTSLQAGAVSGTAYNLSSVSGNAIAVRLTLHAAQPSTGTTGPLVKRLYVRAAPILQSYRYCTYVLNLTGNKYADPPNYLTLRDQATSYDLDGDEMRTTLVASIQKTTTLSITDRFGTFTGIIEPGQTTIEEVGHGYGRGEYKATVTVRQV